MRSHAAGLLASRVDEAEISAAIKPQQIAEIEQALAGVQREERPATEIDMMVGIGKILGLLAGDWTKAARDEFLELAIAEFETMPGGLVMDALARARRRLTHARLLVSWVSDDVEPKAERLRIERETFAKLLELARG